MAHNSRAMELPANMAGLPIVVATPSDVGRLLRELEAVDNHMLQQSLGGKHAAPPKLSSLLDQTVTTNKLDITKAEDRTQLQSFLTAVKQHAPVLHMSFSADPTVLFMEKLIAYLRREMHPLIMVTIGLQPNLGAGCVVRSTNKYFDLSLRKDFQKSKQVLLDKLSEMNKVAA